MYAQWLATTSQTVTYDANGGTGTTAAGSYTDGTAAKPLAIASSGFTRSGYVFDSWNTKADASGTSYAAGDTLRPTADVTLYAVWKKNRTFAIDLNGGTSATTPTPVSGVWDPVSKKYSITVPAAPTDATRDGYARVDELATSPDATSPVDASKPLLVGENESLTFYVLWTKLQALSFDANGGLFTALDRTATTFDSGRPRVGASVTCYARLHPRSQTTVTRTGYTLTGFNSASDGSGSTSCTWPSGTFTMPAADTTLYAQWLATTSQTVTYDANGGTGTTAAGSYTDGTAAKPLAIASSGFTRSGYSFVEWNTKADAAGTAYKAGDTLRPTADTTLYAVWKKTTVTLSFDANAQSTGGAATPAESMEVAPGAATTIPALVPTAPTGYAFAGWNTKQDGSGTTYLAGDSITIQADTTLYAQWKKNRTFAIDLNGGTSATTPTPVSGVWDPVSKKYAVAVPVTIGGIERAGYQQRGLATSPDASSPVDDSKPLLVGENESLTFYMLWAKLYTLNYDANGGQFAAAAKTAKTLYGGWFRAGPGIRCYAMMDARNTTTVTRTGYTLTGFNSASDGSGQASCTWSTGTFTMPEADTVMYAQWVATTSQTVSYDANGGTGTTTAGSYTDGTAAKPLALASSGFTRSGYSFVEWNTKADAAGTGYEPGDTLRPSADLTLYAIWKKTTVTLSFDANAQSTGGAATPAESMEVAPGAATTIPALVPTAPTGYAFAGWNTKQDGSGTTYLAGDSITIQADTTLYARWVELVPQVALALPGGIGVDAAGASATVDASGLKPGSTWELVARSTPVVVGAGTVGPLGAVAFRAVIPRGLEAGTHTVTFTGTSPVGKTVTSVIHYQIDAAGKIARISTDAAIAAAWPPVAVSASNGATASAKQQGAAPATQAQSAASATTAQAATPATTAKATPRRALATTGDRGAGGPLAAAVLALLGGAALLFGRRRSIRH